MDYIEGKRDCYIVDWPENVDSDLLPPHAGSDDALTRLKLIDHGDLVGMYRLEDRLDKWNRGDEPEERKNAEENAAKKEMRSRNETVAISEESVKAGYGTASMVKKQKRT